MNSHRLSRHSFIRVASKRLLVACVLLGAGLPAAQAELKVATLHPMMTDLAMQVGGSHVSVTGLMSPGEDVHQFNPSSSDMATARSSEVILASGKGMELYLPKLQKSLPKSVRVVQAGNAVQSIRVSASSALFVCCPQHASGSIDPHWWHSVSGMKRAAAYVAKEFGKADPANAAAYKANAAAYGQRLDTLSAWAKREIAKVPRGDRILVTSHAAFGYFCKEFGFKSIPVAGLSDENVSSQYLAETIDKVKEHRVRAVFPEQNSNPKALGAIVSATGTGKGKSLIADGSASGVTSYEAFVRHNVEAIVSALAGGGS